MWLVKITCLLLFALSLTACAPSAVIVELAVTPATPTTAKIKQLAGKSNNQNPSTCPLPCTITVDQDSNYEVSFDAPGYYPSIVQFDYLMARSSADELDLGKSNGNLRTPLVIPLVQRTVAKDKAMKNNTEN
jgi:hypothetical protein